MTPPDGLTIRVATPADVPSLMEFNQSMAWETECKRLDQATLAAGIQRIVSDRQLGLYLVAERDGMVIGALMITTEWSDWRNGMFWWIQSVFVLPAYRRQGIYAMLYDAVKQESAAADDVCGFRLYVEKDNAVAQTVYRRLGMTESTYRIYEQSAESAGDG